MGAVECDRFTKYSIHVIYVINALYGHISDQSELGLPELAGNGIWKPAFMNSQLPHLLPSLWLPGKEPLPPGMTEDDREQLMQAKKYADLMSMGMESCITKTVIAGAGGKHL